MTRPNPLVLDGDTVKLRLIADRSVSPDPVHVDWVRFTVQRRCAADLSDVDAVWTDDPEPVHASIFDAEYRLWLIRRNLREVGSENHTPGMQAADLAREVCECLGSEFLPGGDVLKGHDFYKHRLAILRAGAEVGWVGFGASGDSPRQAAQAGTLHVNLFGAACTFASSGWREKLANLIDKRSAVVTRVDFALDYFDGLPGGMSGIVAEYEAGGMDVYGKRPAYDQVGKWLDSDPSCRSFYFGSKQAGKQTNVYEKGDQLYGSEAANPWIRVEVRYGNKIRVLPSDCLRRPGDFFAGSSDWHREKLQAFTQVNPQKIAIDRRRQAETVDSAVARVVRWAHNTAGPAIAVLAKFMPSESFLSFANCETVPGRLQKFTEGDLSGSFARLFIPVNAGPALVAG